jgi:hypothetical protein
MLWQRGGPQTVILKSSCPMNMESSPQARRLGAGSSLRDPVRQASKRTTAVHAACGEDSETPYPHSPIWQPPVATEPLECDGWCDRRTELLFHLALINLNSYMEPAAILIENAVWDDEENELLGSSPFLASSDYTSKSGSAKRNPKWLPGLLAYSFQNFKLKKSSTFI